jgi:uncharacterized protein (DUF433 family)
MPETGTQPSDRRARAHLRTTSDHRNGPLGSKYSPCGKGLYAVARVRWHPDICQPRNQWTIIASHGAPVALPPPKSRSSSANRFPRLDRFLSRDRLCYPTNRLFGIGPCLPVATADPILKRFRAAIHELYGDRAERVVPYGSRTRGDSYEDSDYDVANLYCPDQPRPLSRAPAVLAKMHDRAATKDRHMRYQDIITIEPGKRGGRPTVRGMRIAVADVLGWLATGMSHEQIISDYPELTEEDIRACLACAADRERRLVTAAK